MTQSNHLDPVGLICICVSVIMLDTTMCADLSFVLRFECSKSPVQRGGLFVEVLYYYQRLH